MPVDEKRKPLSSKEKQLIDNIKNARMDVGLTQEELSHRIKKNSNYMGMVESYRRRMSFKTLFKVADVLKIKVVEFFKSI